MAETEPQQTTSSIKITTPLPETETVLLSDIHAMRMEKIIEIARQEHPDMRIISTFQEQDSGQKMDKIVYMLSNKKEPWIITIDPKTGKVTKDRPYHHHQDTVPLEKLLVKLRENFDIVRIVRTRIAFRDDQDVRLIVYTTRHHQQRILTVNATTGAVISDKTREL